ncbi:MAG: general secretion pathway protein A [Gammaproteobacteria bacterium]
MYKEFYRLKLKPFSLLPDPAFHFMSAKHAAALTMIESAVANDLALSVVVGEVGTGKTTLNRRLLSQLGNLVTVGLITTTHCEFGTLMQSVALAFGIPFKGKDKVELYRDFSEFLIKEYAAGRRTLLIIDEAQNLDAITLEEVRLLTNINADDHTLLQLLVIGQPELHQLLRSPGLRQFAQRVNVLASLEPLNEKETADYVRHRLRTAGGDPKLFHKNALRLIHWNSGGIPRVINTLCELALVYGHASNKRKIDAALIADVARERSSTGLYGNLVYDIDVLKATEHAETRESAARKILRIREVGLNVAKPASQRATGSPGRKKRFDVVDEAAIPTNITVRMIAGSRG